MSYIKNEFECHMKNWEKVLNDYTIPDWESLPTIDLYMDQVIALMTQYLQNFASAANRSDIFITPPMVNNYVKLKAMPAPVKKKYSRVHIAYLVMISTLKHTLSIPTIQTIIPLLEDETEVKKMFESFAENQRKAFAYISDKVSIVSNPILEAADANPDRMNDLALQIAVSANILKVLTEDISSIKHNKGAENEEILKNDAKN